MNNYQNDLYNELITLAQSNEAFYFSDFELDDKFYRIFLYRLASYTDFCELSAFESRGTMFEMKTGDEYSHAKELVSLPFEKFFNFRENDFTMNPDWGSAISVQDKRDGSLISTYMHNEKLRLKSKGSISSPQCLDAMEWLDRKENDHFRADLTALTRKGYTVIMEWTAPYNRIVLGYENPNLTVLAVRLNCDGSYVDILDLQSFPAIQVRWVEDYMDYVEKEYTTVEEFVESIANRENIEGFVIVLESGQRIKIKANWYLTRHRMKDSVNCPRRLFEAVIDEASDDLRTLFVDDPAVLKQIGDMEKFADGIYNHSVDSVERFYERNKHFDRKSYAILGQKELIRADFGLAMMKYVGKELNYKESIKKRWRELGLKNKVLLEEGEE